MYNWKKNDIEYIFVEGIEKPGPQGFKIKWKFDVFCGARRFFPPIGLVRIIDYF